MPEETETTESITTKVTLDERELSSLFFNNTLTDSCFSRGGNVLAR